MEGKGGVSEANTSKVGIGVACVGTAGAVWGARAARGAVLGTQGVVVGVGTWVVGAATQAFGLSIRNKLHEETRLDMWREMMM
ncbi:unnamed protein product, partial [Ilex paraguariensis]